uniref:BAH domain-containing protein n=1 Tax=Oryza punctata TaxID=4537 RepID=A0A0E0JJP4_ORYPU
MGRRRRFAQLASTSDDDDDDAPAADAPKPKPPPPSSSGAKKQKQRRLAAADDDDDDVDEDDLELEEEEEDEKDLEEMRKNEEEERREETQTRRRRRRRGRKPKRPAEESEEEEEEAKAEEAREEENTEAVPIGEPVKITGRGKKQRKHYTSFEYEGNTFELEDPVLLTPEDSKEKPYVAILKDITETEGSLSVTGQWFYRPEEADKKGGGSWKASDTRELFYSFHIDDVPAESVMHKCVVHFIPQHKKIPSRKEHPGFIVQKVYDTVAKKLWNLTDKDYEDNKQHEIDLLVKKTIDRIGQLSDIEPADAPGDNNDQLSNKRGLRKRPMLPIDVSRDDASAGKSEQFGKAETPGSDKLKNYATLVKYKAVTGDQYRDRWLDKLVDTIPLTSKESSGASHADPGGATKSSTNGSSAKEDNEKSYSPDVIVSIMASLERSTYEALGSDFQKYNQKLRQLLFNIKNSPVLRNRLMNKELDPPVLLTMSPDELKVGLTAAERTSEPEESRKLQMTDARCVRCAEKEVGVSDIIHAGHGDRYQLECNACGHSWFSSRDAITTLTVDTPTSAGGNVGTAPWATAKFDVMEKQLTSPRDHQPDKPLADALQKSMPTLEKQKSFGKQKPDEPSSAPAASHEANVMGYIN